MCEEPCIILYFQVNDQLNNILLTYIEKKFKIGNGFKQLKICQNILNTLSIVNNKIKILYTILNFKYLRPFLNFNKIVP